MKSSTRATLKIFHAIDSFMVNYRVIIEQDEDGILIARVPDLPGCATEGKNREELMINVKEAIEAYLEALKKDGNPIPIEMAQINV
jgi:predicted RNase H-like HicB family nuclease